jgi:hypothetical protein
MTAPAPTAAYLQPDDLAVDLARLELFLADTPPIDQRMRDGQVDLARDGQVRAAGLLRDAALDLRVARGRVVAAARLLAAALGVERRLLP